MENSVRPMRRSLGILLFGVLLGSLLSYIIWSTRPGAGLSRSRSDGNSQGENRQHSALASQPTEEEKILLGEIATVPFQELYETLSNKRPEEIDHLVQQLRQLPPNQQTQAKIKAFFTAWAHLDANAAFKSALTFDDPAAGDAAVAAVIMGADADAVGVIAASLLGLPGDKLSDSSKRTLFDLAIQKWSEADPAAAARVLSDSKLQKSRITPAYFTVASNWAMSDPAAALAWAQEQGGGPIGLNPVLGAVAGWWKKDPSAAKAYALSQANTPLGKQLIPFLAGQMVEQDRTQATAWVRGIPSDELRKQAFGMMAAQVAVNDPKGASEWALTLPEEALRDALSSTVSIWAQSDPVAAAHWLEGLGGGGARDAAVSSFSNAIAETDPEVAIAWAVTITDGARRTGATRQAMNEWLKRDPTAARTWIQNSSLGDAEKARLLAAPSPSPPR